MVHKYIHNMHNSKPVESCHIRSHAELIDSYNDVQGSSSAPGEFARGVGGGDLTIRTACC